MNITEENISEIKKRLSRIQTEVMNPFDGLDTRKSLILEETIMIWRLLKELDIE